MGARNRGLISLIDGIGTTSLPSSTNASRPTSRKRPALEAIYRFKQRLCYALLEKARNQKRCERLAHRFLRDIAALRCCGLAPLVQLGNTLHAWREEIATMWRFTRNNEITEGFHTKMEALQRQAYGFRTSTTIPTPELRTVPSAEQQAEIMALQVAPDDLPQFTRYRNLPLLIPLAVNREQKVVQVHIGA